MVKKIFFLLFISMLMQACQDKSACDCDRNLSHKALVGLQKENSKKEGFIPFLQSPCGNSRRDMIFITDFLDHFISPIYVNINEHDNQHEDNGIFP